MNDQRTNLPAGPSLRSRYAREIRFAILGASLFGVLSLSVLILMVWPDPDGIWEFILSVTAVWMAYPARLIFYSLGLENPPLGGSIPFLAAMFTVNISFGALMGLSVSHLIDFFKESF